MDYVVEGAGQADFVRFWRLMAEAVRGHPSAVGAELMNEPVTIKRGACYKTWRACADAIHQVIPDMAIALADIGEGAVIPAVVSQASSHLYYIERLRCPLSTGSLIHNTPTL